MMKLVLEQELGLSPQWLVDQSNTTQENAICSAEILKKEGLIFVPAPMGFYQKTALTPLDFYRSSEGFQRTR